MSEKQDLLDNIREYLKKAEESMKDNAFNSASTLYFKAIAILMDLFILEREGYIPTNHNKRFRLLEDKYPELYKILDKDFPIYQGSYRTKLTKEHAKIFEDDFKKTLEFTNLKIN